MNLRRVSTAIGGSKSGRAHNPDAPPRTGQSHQIAANDGAGSIRFKADRKMIRRRAGVVQARLRRRAHSRW